MTFAVDQITEAVEAFEKANKAFQRIVRSYADQRTFQPLAEARSVAQVGLIATITHHWPAVLVELDRLAQELGAARLRATEMRERMRMKELEA